MNEGIVIKTHGGPQEMVWAPLPPAKLRRNDVRIRHTAIGVNYIDVYDRTGLYPRPVPMGLGREAAGVVVEVGKGVKSVKEGDRVAYVLATPGSYALSRVVPADRVIALPAEISDQQAACLMLKGLTAAYLVRQTYRVKRHETIVVHAAAGGLGSMLVQWAKHLGATVIGVVGSHDKALVAEQLGAAWCVNSHDENWASQIRAYTAGEGVPVVYDSVGKDTFTGSLECLRRRGLMVSIGNASGPVPPFALLELSKRGSLYVTRPTLFDYIHTRSELKRLAAELFAVVSGGAVNVHIGQTFPVRDARLAHTALEARTTIGCTVLTV
jgi:NADPH:quinone reductase